MPRLFYYYDILEEINVTYCPNPHSYRVWKTTLLNVIHLSPEETPKSRVCIKPGMYRTYWTKNEITKHSLDKVSLEFFFS